MAKYSIGFTAAVLLAASFGAVTTTAQSTQTLDTATGLIEAAGWLEVKATCTECHSAQMIVQNSGSRSVWKSRIAWMQETQGLGPLSESQEDSILSYLALNYGQKEATRRPAIPSHLMPANPLGSVD
ncbi:MAG: hypothetical protein ACI95C_002201 [Pseudohongiellaceae bacterium]|jgi:hypothetical protein